MGKNITYLLGAGASYHSIPVVEAMKDRMEFFINMCGDTMPLAFGLENSFKMDSPNIDTSYYGKIELSNILDKYRSILDETLKHRTVDTYAKKLFLRKEEIKLNLLKEFLCLYFAFEQAIDNRKIVKGKSYKNLPQESQQSILDNLNCCLDYRYDVFLASLLGKDMKLPDNVNIISWNYDHQIELAYMDYALCTFNEAKTHLKIYPHDKAENGQIIKLNGSANQFILNDKVHAFEYYLSKNDLYIDIIHEITTPKSLSEKGEYALNFAWEKTPIQKKAISLSKGIIEKTDELIIIGYSFPYFNRSVDIDILSNCNASTIKVQCLHSDFKGIKQSLLDIWGEDISSQIHYHDDLSQFYIPSVQFYNN